MQYQNEDKIEKIWVPLKKPQSEEVIEYEGDIQDRV